MYELFDFVSLIEKPTREKNQNKGNGTVNAKYKILLEGITSRQFLVATAVSNKEARKAAKKLRPNGMVKIILGQGEPGSFLEHLPVIHVSKIEVITFYKTEKV
jgi:hypothetical protein